MSSRNRDISGLTGSQRKDEFIPKGKNYLFVVAIDDYDHLPKLSNCVKDANAIIQQLVHKYNFKQKNVFKLYNQDASIDNIYKRMSDMSRAITDKDNLMIFFAGHGFYDKESKTGHLIPVNAEEKNIWDFLSNSNFLDLIRAIKSMHTLVVLDSCFSGSMFSSRGIGASYAESVANYKSRWGMAAGRIEAVDDGLHGENSPFAKAIIDFLKENTNTKFPVSDLIQYVKKVTANNSGQTPIAGPIKNLGDEGGEFVFELETDIATEWEKTLTANSEIAYNTFISNYPESVHIGEAKDNLRPLRAASLWSEIQHMPHKKLAEVVEKQRMITEYKFHHPDGKHRIKADKLLVHLKETEELLKKKNGHQAAADNESPLVEPITPAKDNWSTQEVNQQPIVGNKKEVINQPSASSVPEVTSTQKKRWWTNNKIATAVMIPIIAMSSFFLVGLMNKNKADNGNMDALVFNSLQDSKEVQVYTDFIDKFPRSEYVSEVQALKAELEYWQKMVANNTVNGYDSYLVIFEDGRFRAAAADAIKALEPTKPASESGGAISQNTTVAPKPSPKPISNTEEKFWKDALAQNTEMGYITYLRNYPNSTYDYEAKRAIKKLKGKGRNKKKGNMTEAWDHAKQVNTRQSYKEFIRKYPNSTNKKEAQAQLYKLGGKNNKSTQ